MHCGFCLPTCPSYAVFEDEMDSPRGRIVLMKVGHEPGQVISAEMVTHFDRCLGCMACVTACPSGVQYDKLIERTRPQLERSEARSWQERALPQGDLRALHASRPAAGARAGLPDRAQARAAGADGAAEVDPLAGARRAAVGGSHPPAARSSRPRRPSSAGPWRSCRAASSACSSATSTPRRCACSRPRAGRSTRRARRAAAARCRCTPGRGRGVRAGRGDDRRLRGLRRRS